MSSGSVAKFLRASAVVGLTAVVTLGAALPANAANGPNLVLDGGFESYQPYQTLVNNPIPGLGALAPWYEDAGTSDDVSFAALDSRIGPADSGQQHFFAQQYQPTGPSPEAAYVLSQDVATTPGETYFVSFATRSADPAADVSATVQMHSGATTLQTLTVAPSSTWQTYTYTFVASAATTTISLMSEVVTSGYGLARFDSVVVQHVPIEDTPLISPSVALAAGGVFVVGAAVTLAAVVRRRKAA